MFYRFYLWLRRHLLHIDDRSQLSIAIENGLSIGKDCSIMGEVIIDPGHCWLIEIGDRVTLAPRVHLLAHDASTKRELGYAVIGRVIIGNDVFVGAGSIILPGVIIGSRVIIGAGTIVSKSIPDNSVVVGNPARMLCTYEEYMQKRKNEMSKTPVFDSSFKIDVISEVKKEEMKKALKSSIGFVE